MGEDNLDSLPKWKNAEKLMSDYQIIVYPRTFEGGTSTSLSVSKIKNQENINIINAPIIELSATEIRNMIKEGKNVRPMLPPEVFEYLDGSSFYK
jgi:nicotinate-nucleotide adenylyltransferase